MVGRSGLVAALLVVPLLAGCSGSDDSSAEKTARPTPIAKLDVAAVRLVRAEFCERLPDSAVEAALGGKPESDDSWTNGDPVPGSAGTAADSGSGDVGHELGCAWAGRDNTAARAWVFARSVDAGFAGALVQQAGQQQGCTAEQTPAFGTPAVLQTCTLPGNVQRVRRAGLFGDTWLTCEVSGVSSPTLARRTDRWCAAVVAALDAA
jgi:hypothetical protein